MKQAENTIRSVQYKVDDPCEPPNHPKILEKNPCKEFPNVQKESHFFVVIPVRGNKYYIPPNRIDPSNKVKFLGNKNYEEF